MEATEIANGPVPCLSKREMEVLVLAAWGQSHKLIAQELGISEWTVKNHSTSINHKLKAFDKAHSIYLACKLGMIDGNSIKQ